MQSRGVNFNKNYKKGWSGHSHGGWISVAWLPPARKRRKRTTPMVASLSELFGRRI